MLRTSCLRSETALHCLFCVSCEQIHAKVGLSYSPVFGILATNFTGFDEQVRE